MSKKINWGTITLGILVVILVVVNYATREKSAFFDYNQVYNNCGLKIQLEKTLGELTSKRKSELDSMQLELTLLSQRIESQKSAPGEVAQFEGLKNRYLAIKEKYEEENLRLKEGYFNQIREEINKKARLYAEKHGYDFLFAAVGDGSLMYGSSTKDVTEDFKLFVDKSN